MPTATSSACRCSLEDSEALEVRIEAEDDGTSRAGRVEDEAGEAAEWTVGAAVEGTETADSECDGLTRKERGERRPNSSQDAEVGEGDFG